jgi:hypothetical protein
VSALVPLLAAGLAAGCAPSPTFAAAALAAASFTVVVLPDTQYYAALHPDILDAQTSWIAGARADAHIALVLHEGDIVDADDPVQWQRAARSLHRLDGLVPVVLSAGNHDYHRDGAHVDRRTLINDYFPASWSARAAPIGGTFQPGHIENSFHVVDLPGGPWLILSLEFGPRDAVLAWADDVAKRYASLPAMVVTHAYLYADDSRYDHLARPDQRWNPHRYLDDQPPGAVNDGEEIWRKLISRNGNIAFVLCGHDLGDGVGRLTSVRSDGTKVQQILANYQMQPLGGEGYLRLMELFPAERRVSVRTYSPYLGRFKSDAGNRFDLEY